MTSYIKILQKLDAFCTAHLQIKKFMGEFREQMPNFSTMDERYPIVFASPISDVEDLNTNQFTLEIYCVDIIQKDRANLNTIVSDCHLILKDLFIYYRDDNDADLDVVGTASISFVNNFDLDYVAGAVMTITFEVAGYGSCEIPMSPITPVTNDCEPATLIVRDSDNNVLYTLTVDSGATETQVIADSTYLVEYENGTPIESGSILAEGSAVIQVPNPVTCADATAELYFDGELIDTMQIPAGDTDSFNIDCATTLNAVRVTSVSLSHAHTGTFVYVGDVNGKPSYEKSDDADRIIYYDGTRWILEKLGGGAHTHEAAIGNEAFPWLADWSLEDISMVQATIGTYCQNGGDALNILVNGTIEGDVNNAYPVEIEITDGVNPVTPDAVTIIGNTVTIEAPDALVRFRYANITTGATFTDLYPIVSGGEKFLYIENSLAQLARAVVDATRPVTTYRLRDSAITLKNTANATISTTNVPATVNQDITAPDATVENSNASYTDSVVSGGTLVLPDITVTDSDGSTYTQPSVENVVCTLSPDTTLEVNGTPEGTFAAGSTIEVNITDGVNPVTPDAVTVVGDVVTIEVPAATAAPVGATLMKTGQTTSYRTGDDGDIEAGRAADFLTLASNNPFGNTNRFTDELGGSTYTNNIVIDWSTYNGVNVLGWHRIATTGVNWDTAIDNSLSFSISIFTSGWRLPNLAELSSLNRIEFGANFAGYSPFNLPNIFSRFWTSTNDTLTTNTKHTISNGCRFFTESITLNAAAYRYIPCRTFTVTGTTLT